MGIGTGNDRPRVDSASAEERSFAGDRRKDFRTREKGRHSLQIAGFDPTGATAQNSAFELWVRLRKSFSDLRFAVRPTGQRQRNGKLAEREGFEPSVEFPLHTLSKRAPSTTRTSLRVFRISSLQASGCAGKPELCSELCKTSSGAATTYGDPPTPTKPSHHSPTPSSIKLS